MVYRFFQIRILIKRILSVLIVYSLIRLIFFSFHYKSFSNSSLDDLLIAFLHGIRFDLSAIVYLNLIYILLSLAYQFFNQRKNIDKALQYFFYLSNFAGILFNVIDVEYYKFQKKRTGFELFSGENDIMTMLPSYLKTYWYLILISLICTYIIHRFYVQTLKQQNSEVKKYYGLKAVSSVMFLVLVVIAARGGLQTKPVRIISASYYGNAQNASLVLNTPFTIIQSIGKKTLAEKKYLSTEEADKLIQLKKDYTSSYMFEKKNVVIFILESFSTEYIGAVNKSKKGYSPFLDSLIQHSYVFENAYSNGKKSNEAMPSIVSSLPSLQDESFTNSTYQGNELSSLPKLLKHKGYYSAFFHGGFNGSMSFDAYAKNAGYDDYYGFNEYENKNDYDGNWGIYDGAFMQFFGQKLSSAHKPFFATLFTLSSHPPYTIPQKYANKYKASISAKHKSYLYTDESLREFFDYAKTKNWYTNTVFVFVPDHTPDADDEYYNTKVSYYQIPIIVFDPSTELVGRSTKVVSQVDIMPSLLDYLHFDQPFLSFGNSFWKMGANPKSVNYRDGIFQCIDSSYVLQYADDKVLALYNFKNDWYLRRDIKNTNSKKVDELKRYLEAYIQTYNNTLIKNTYKVLEKENTIHN